MSKDPFYITTAISYPNGAPHIGHAYEAIATDAIARFMRLCGRDVYFLTGTDEHGLKMEQTARKLDITAQELADQNSAEFIKMAKLFHCSNDDFIRTSEQRHKKSVATLWNKLKEAGDIYLDKYEGWYSIRDEAYYEEGETSLNEGGVRIGPQGTEVEWTSEETYFFKLTKYQDKLLALYEEKPDFIHPKTRANEVINFVENGLRDLSVSRTTFKWGIPVPGDEAHVIYVWVDALANYLSALGYPDEENELYQKFWPANFHIIGKDIVRFHAIYWPAFLISAGLPLPKQIFAHGFLFNKGEKMSKSLGNVISPETLAKAYGVDQLRYFLLREVSFGQDGNYSDEAIITRVNADLANDLGNLAQRSLSMIFKNCEGQIPTSGDFSTDDIEILSRVDQLYEKIIPLMAELKLHKVLETIMNEISGANRYFAGQEPWALKKTDPERMKTVLFVTAELIRQFAIILQPFMPMACKAFLDYLKIDEEKRDFAALGVNGRLVSGIQIDKPKAVFPRIEQKEAENKQSA